MSDFDPDAFLAKNQMGGGFDPDAFLASRAKRRSADTKFGPEIYVPERDGALVPGGATEAPPGILDPALTGLASFTQGRLFGLPTKLMAARDAGNALLTPGKDTVETYRQRRDFYDNRLDEAQDRNPISSGAAGFAGLVSGGGSLAKATGLDRLGQKASGLVGIGKRLLAGGAAASAQEGLTGAVESDGDLTRGQVGEVARDATSRGARAFKWGVGGQALLGEPLRALANPATLVARADEGIAKAKTMATAMAEKDAAKRIASLKGDLGAEVQKGSRMTENIRRIPGDLAEMNARERVDLLRMGAQIARERADEALLQAKAIGLEEGPDKIGEFLSKGSKLDKAQQARAKAEAMLRAADDMQNEAARIASGKVLPDLNAPNLKMARELALESAPFKQLEGQVLSRNLQDLPEQSARIIASKATLDDVVKNRADDVAKGAEELLSPTAGLKRFKEVGLRYGLPILGASLGSMGGPVVAGIGAATGAGVNHAIGALAGAGLRPGAQALYRTFTQHPAAQNLMWSGVKRVAQMDPARAAPFAPALAAAGRRAPEPFAAGNEQMSPSSEEDRRRMIIEILSAP